jgi:DNA-binding response OmpR family regulator
MASILSILIIEDDDLTAQLYQKLLEDADYNVLTAANTLQAEQTLAGIEINLIILDFNLPDRQGVDWLLDLRAQIGFERLPVILVSGIQQNPGDLRDDRYVWFMEKPRQPQQIVTAVQSTIERFSR